MLKWSNKRFSDLETTGPKYYALTGKTEVRIAVLTEYLNNDPSKPLAIHTFTTLKDYFEHLSITKYKKTIIYFCNLSFDGDFLIKYLYANSDIVDEITKLDFHGKSKISKDLYNVGDKYIIDFCIGSKLASLIVRFKTGNIVEFRCQFLLYPMKGGVAAYGKSLNLRKLDENVSLYDCSEEEFLSHSRRWLSDRFDYAKRDVEIAYRYAQRDFLLDEDSPLRMRKTPLTAAATIRKLIRDQNTALYDHFWARDIFGYYFDTTNDREWLQYRGGFTFMNEYCANKTLTKCYSLDINSSYPSQYNKYPMPCLRPTVYKTLPKILLKSKLYALCINIKSAILKDQSDLPTSFPPILPKTFELGLKGNYIKNFVANKALLNIVVWTEEWEWYNKYYKLEYDIYKVYEFETTMYLSTTSQRFIDKKFNASIKLKEAIKAGDTLGIGEYEAKKQAGKLNINSLYGKFGENPEYVSAKFIPEDNDWINISTGEADFIMSYPPVASYITMKGRVQMYKNIEILLSLGANVFYGDTDSLKFNNIDIEKYKDVLNIGDDLGQWEWEKSYDEFKYLAPKTYMSITNGKTSTTIKGYNGIIEPTMDEFTYGIAMDDRLLKKKVVGGTVLMEKQPYVINKTPYLIDTLPSKKPDSYYWVNNMIELFIEKKARLYEYF